MGNVFKDLREFITKLEEYIRLVREKLTNLDFDMKRLSLELIICSDV